MFHTAAMSLFHILLTHNTKKSYIFLFLKIYYQITFLNPTLSAVILVPTSEVGTTVTRHSWW